MNQPWKAESVVDADLACHLIEQQFPPLAPVSVQDYGAGWDNNAYLVNGRYVFRFPRRNIAVELLEREAKLLPRIAEASPLAVPLPEFHGQPSDAYRWPFAGYQALPGRSADHARLNHAERCACAPALGRFLAYLHALPVDEMRTLGAATDTMGRLDLANRVPTVLERLVRIEELGLMETAPLEKLATESLRLSIGEVRQLIHGDFYCRHVLVDDQKLPCGVIDWGDVHLGHPAQDLLIAHAFLPREAHDGFRDSYGNIDKNTWALARYFALYSCTAIIVYGHDVGDQDLKDEGLGGLQRLLEGCS